MRHEKARLAKVLVLAMVAAAAAAVTTAPDPAEWLLGEPAIDGPARCAPDHAQAPGSAQLEPLPALDLTLEQDLLEPTAICRLMPQCWDDADCDGICGAGQGKCVHSRCPVRVCRCG